jgi:hypothetical protein
VAAPVSEHELEHPTLWTIPRLVRDTLVALVRDPTGILVASAFLVLMLWGFHGSLDLLGVVWSGWEGPGSDPATRTRILHGVPWDQEWISFWAGVVLVVGIPALLIRLVFHQPLSDYGLGLPRAGRRRLAWLSALALLVVSIGPFYLGAQDAGMRATYPLYRGTFDSDGDFLLYELGYLPFFVAIEFIFRGYLLFGIARLRDAPDRMALGRLAIVISMLSYTAWHLGKPLPELWGTLVWGILAGTIVLATRTIWPVVTVHWLLNVFLDLAIYKDL